MRVTVSQSAFPPSKAGSGFYFAAKSLAGDVRFKKVATDDHPMNR
jgi:hypothetical protein